MNKKMIIIGVSILLVIGLIGGGLYYALGASSESTEEQGSNKKRIVEPENVIPVAERPVIYLTPKADGHNIDILVESIKKPATEAEYTLEYQTGTLVQAQQNVIQLGNLPITETVFLGSCSAGGKCTFHEDIAGGILRTRFSGSGDAYVLKSDWKYVDNSTKETAFSSKDAKFQISSDDLATQKYVVIFNTPGYPDGLEGTVASELYSFQTSAELEGTATLTIRGTQEGNLVIMGWDGTQWQEFTGTVEGKAVTAEVALLPLYVAVVK